MSFEKNVFVNCPFDERYLPLLRPLLFTIIYLGMFPRIALERADSGESRLTKIVELIRDSKYSIHDFGGRFFGADGMSKKKTLVLEAKPHRYKAAISDLSGSDIECHFDIPYKVIGVVRNWLKSVCLAKAAGTAKIEAAFTQFMTEDYNALTAEGFAPGDIATLPIGELMERMYAWVAAGSDA